MARASREHRAWCQDALVPVSRVLAEHERYHSREVPAFSLEGMLGFVFFKTLRREKRSKRLDGLQRMVFRFGDICGQ